MANGCIMLPLQEYMEVPNTEMEAPDTTKMWNQGLPSAFSENTNGEEGGELRGGSGEADGNVSPIASFIPEPLLDAGNPHKIRGSGEFNKQGSVVGHGFHDFPYMVNNVGHFIEERHVVRDQDKSIFVIL